MTYFNIRFDQFFIHSPGALWFNGQHLWSVLGNILGADAFVPRLWCVSGIFSLAMLSGNNMNSGLAFARFKQKGYQ
ncbi:hypothetical protein KP22_12725 [Pectobacterium betavasculorum]|uniref:Uncharacterized protein n=1 Tax=Pectobacterium betavasculorum TaxID=55207 RepID=A0A093T1F1_9GAMM|nr:hypothetical protein KP22_12725 [Pectobacterium betavasculorum]KFX21647.1 hypothetical protein JV35_00350 [Pectobacterium betavasculorum]